MIIPALTLLVALALPQVVPVVLDKDSDTMALAFDTQLTDVNDAPVDVDQAEFIFRPNPPPADPVPLPLRVVRDMQRIIFGENVYMVKDLLVTVPVGTFDVTVRIRSQSGSWSDESVKLFSEVVSKKPRAPTNLRKHVVGG